MHSLHQPGKNVNPTRVYSSPVAVPFEEFLTLLLDVAEMRTYQEATRKASPSQFGYNALCADRERAEARVDALIYQYLPDPTTLFEGEAQS